MKMPIFVNKAYIKIKKKPTRGATLLPGKYQEQHQKWKSRAMSVRSCWPFIFRLLPLVKSFVHTHVVCLFNKICITYLKKQKSFPVITL